jgi:4-amino-4-deoxy-L-arabinose transferase-like glycosyltransferase
VICLAAIIGAAALLRFWSLGSGIPYALGVDEPEIVERAVHIIKSGDFNPHFFDYPSLYIYLQALVAVPRFIWGALSGQWGTLAAAPASAFYVWARAVTATLGTATVYLVYRCARRWDEPTALVAAAIMAVMPLHVRESHFALTDVPVTFFVALTWLLSLAAHRRPDTWRFVLAGAAAGLATATKYNAVFAIVMPLLACTAPRMRLSRLQAVAIVAAACAVAFVIAAPYTLLDLPGFLDGFARLVAAYNGPSPAQSPVVTYAKHLRNAVGWPGAIAGAAGLLLGIVQIAKGPNRATWALAIVFPVVYYVFIARQHIVFARYLLPAVPFVAVLGAVAIVAATRWVGARSRRGALIVAAVLVGAAVAPGAVTAVQFDREIGRTWTSELAYQWILTHIPHGSRVVIESRNLLLPVGYDATNVPQLRQQSLDAYRAAGVSYLVASSQCYGPYLASPAWDPAAYADYMRLFVGTEELARFTPSRQHPGSELRILKVPR